ncbi:MAG: hypothetical protein HYV63_07635 [Candidatus Schekmanbacteria bacterium]|nr:hypothetical protein [Candidatus Schekmanbacteria bacterium]
MSTRNRIVLEAELLAPLVLKGNRQSQRSDCLDCIPGTTLRGALAGAYLRFGGTPAEAAFRRLFLDAQQARWATLRTGLHVPPLTAASCKRSPGFSGQDEHGVVDLLVAVLRAPEGEGREECPRPGCGQPLKPFGKAYDRTSTGPKSTSAPKATAMHVGIDRDTGAARHSIFFSEEAIADFSSEEAIAGDAGDAGAPSRQPTPTRIVLRGVVELGDAARADFDALLGDLGGIVRIGRSRSRGRGKVCLKLRETLAAPSAADYEATARDLAAAARRSGERVLTLGFPNGAILVDEVLRFANDPAVSIPWLPALDRWDSPPDRIRPLYARTRLQLVRGWNVAHQLPRQDDMGILSGSVFAYTVPAAQWPGIAAELVALAEHGVGLRREEGFGTVSICDRFHLDAAIPAAPGSHPGGAR